MARSAFTSGTLLASGTAATMARTAAKSIGKINLSIEKALILVDTDSGISAT